MEHSAHAQAYAHMYTSSSVATTLVVDLQDKYYSEKLDYRYRPPPNARQLCVGGSFVPSNVTRVRARLKNLRDYHPDLLLQASNLSLFFPARQTAISHEFSVYLNHAKWCRHDGGRWTGKPREHTLPQRKTISRTNICECRVTYLVCSSNYRN